MFASKDKMGTPDLTVQERQAKVERGLDWPHLSTTPIHRLPEELLARIFSSICDEGVNVFKGPGEIWILQEVCARWRNIIRDTPLLWRNIRAEEQFPSDSCKLPVALTRTLLCLELSRSIPLYVTLHTTKREIVSALASHVHRWEHLKLDRDSQSVLVGRSKASDKSESMIQPGVLNRLQSLDFVGISHMMDCNMFRGANVLEDVKLSRCHFTPGASDFPWANVKCLSLVRCVVNRLKGYDIGSLFRALSHLEELEWTLNIENFQPMSSAVTLLYVRTLRIESSEVMSRIIPMLRFLRLTKFGIIDGTLTNIDSGAIVSMLKLSGCSIKKLDLCMERLADVAHLLQILKEAHTVEDLNLLLSPEQSPEILSSLIWNPTADSKGSLNFLLPSLRKLEVQPSNNYPINAIGFYIDRMARIVRSRGIFSSLSGDAAEIDDRQLPFAALSLVMSRFDIPAEEFATYRARIDDLENFGEQCGVEVQIEACSITHGVR